MESPVQRDLSPYLRSVPDWPKPGVDFLDITPMLASPVAFASAVASLAAPGRGPDGPAVDLVVGVEARGFILGAAVAEHLGVGFVPIRKHGKLPQETYRTAYALEYGEAVLEIHRDSCAGARVLLVDDVLATGGTLAAAAGLLAQAEAELVAVSVLIEITSLGGRAKASGLPLHAVIER